MKEIQSRHAKRILVAFVSFAFILTAPASLSGQKRRPTPSPPTKSPSSDSPSPTSRPILELRSAEQASMEMGILMSRRTLTTDLERQRNRAKARLAEDLDQLEQINTSKLVPLSSATPIDYKNLAQTTAEIKNRATRVKFYSPVALVDKTGQKFRVEADASQLGIMLPQLSSTIKKFVENPVFRVSAPNDAQLRSAAGHDLEAIIKLSDAINKIAKRLSKPLVASR